MIITTGNGHDPSLDPGVAEWITAFADDEHLLGARHAAWIGLGPFLEEDLAFCSIAQDELGHAIALYEFVTDDVDGWCAAIVDRGGVIDIGPEHSATYAIHHAFLDQPFQARRQ